MEISWRVAQALKVKMVRGEKLLRKDFISHDSVIITILRY